MNKTKLILLVILTGLFFPGFSQSIPKDPGALDLINLGKRYMKNTNYPQALRMFEDAMIRDYSQTTTVAIYMTGLSYYNMEDYANARQYFDILLKEYPLSKYTEDARYHMALLGLKSTSDKELVQACVDLYKLYDELIDGDVSKECHAAVQHFLFYKATGKIGAQVFEKVDAKYKQEVCEAAAYRLVQEEKRDEAKVLIQKHLKTGGKESGFLKVLMMEKKTPPKAVEKDIAKVCLFMPLYIDNTDVASLREVPMKSQVALEFTEGFLKAVDDHNNGSGKQIYLKIFDTQRDNEILGAQLAELEDLYPDVIVGEVFNRQSRVLADWAESKGVAQIVPLSPTIQLADKKNQVVLARPAAATHGKKMAEYAFNITGVKKVAVWNDKKSVTVEMANAFEKRFKELGGQVVPMQIDSLYQRAIGQIPYCMNGIKNQGCDAMYIPMSNEESVGLILSYLGASSIKIFASPDIESFYTMDRELKERIGIYFSTSYLPDENSRSYAEFYNGFLAKYGLAPTETNIRGYDLGKFLLTLLDEYSPSKGGFNEFVKNHPRVKALHLDFDFGGQSDNQAIHIMQYTPSGVLKRNL